MQHPQDAFWGALLRCLYQCTATRLDSSPVRRNMPARNFLTTRTADFCAKVYIHSTRYTGFIQVWRLGMTGIAGGGLLLGVDCPPGAGARTRYAPPLMPTVAPTSWHVRRAAIRGIVWQ